MATVPRWLHHRPITASTGDWECSALARSKAKHHELAEKYWTEVARAIRGRERGGSQVALWETEEPTAAKGPSAADCFPAQPVAIIAGLTWAHVGRLVQRRKLLCRKTTTEVRSWIWWIVLTATKRWILRRSIRMMEAMTSFNIGACCAAALSGCVCFVEVANKSDPPRTIASESSLAGVVNKVRLRLRWSLLS